MSDTLGEGQRLQRGESLVSNNGAYTLTLQEDGNLVLAADGTPVWATATDGQDVVRAELQTDGNFVLYTPERPVWHSDTVGSKSVRLVLQDDRNLVLYAADGPAWATATQTDTPPADLQKSVGAPEMTGAAQAAQPVGEAAPEPIAEAVADEPAEPAPNSYTVVSGDTLWGIAERFYGDGNKYQVLVDANAIPNPDLIHPGQVLTIP
ncbi:LysM peptidoglycan-binding domain-containing protein [Mycobacterium kansasii]|uniref:Lectin n=3 Tax=Mycobacterium kansasii TaxID=1768 RepID=A0A1V3XMV4_MYCKA|nr:LysM peptidoglycan-binding domain-containing protein [Mycobacterium kansasii]EUA02130.1 outer membrane autotransporter barrel domain protein [Mycobacterium kansasii 824]AGZ49776.1 lectin [Mycobacterium kansasii ATCC 12478]ARG58323.1 lectin [Mycobacterium kansasii]ARG63839.1 lectin [Mycobacterium kansasii]ARG71482.1 lectin [Mycobacterium kansasii]